MMYPNPALVDMRPGAFTGMGLTAENVAERYNIGRDEQDEFGARSQQKAEAAIKAGRFKSQIVPLTVKKQKQLPNGHFEHEEIIFDTDEGMRPGTTKEGIVQYSSGLQTQRNGHGRQLVTDQRCRSRGGAHVQRRRPKNWG